MGKTTPIKNLGLPNQIQRYLETANIKTIEELCELPLDVLFKVCNNEKATLIEIFKKLDDDIIVN